MVINTSYKTQNSGNGPDGYCTPTVLYTRLISPPFCELFLPSYVLSVRVQSINKTLLIRMRTGVAPRYVSFNASATVRVSEAARKFSVVTVTLLYMDSCRIVCRENPFQFSTDRRARAKYVSKPCDYETFCAVVCV